MISVASLFVDLSTSVHADAEGHLAVHRAFPEPPSCQCEHNFLWYGSIAFYNLKNVHVSSGLLCYFIYWSIQFPFMFVSPQKIRYLFLAKAIIVPPTWLALLIWAFVKVPPKYCLLTPKNTLSNIELRLARMSAFNSALGFFATTGLNMSNFTVSNRILNNRVYPCNNHLRDMRKPRGRACNQYDLIQRNSYHFSVNMFNS